MDLDTIIELLIKLGKLSPETPQEYRQGHRL